MPFKIDYLGYGGMNATEKTISTATNQLMDTFRPGDFIYHYVNRLGKIRKGGRIYTYIHYENGNYILVDQNKTTEDGNELLSYRFRTLEQAITRSIDMKYDREQDYHWSGYFKIFTPAK